MNQNDQVCVTYEHLARVHLPFGRPVGHQLSMRKLLLKPDSQALLDRHAMLNSLHLQYITNIAHKPTGSPRETAPLDIVAEQKGFQYTCSCSFLSNVLLAPTILSDARSCSRSLVTFTSAAFRDSFFFISCWSSCWRMASSLCSNSLMREKTQTEQSADSATASWILGSHQHQRPQKRRSINQSFI